MLAVRMVVRRGSRGVLKQNGDHHLWSVHRVGETVRNRRSLPHDRNISGDPGRMSLRSRTAHAEGETKQASFDSCCITTRDNKGPSTTALRARRCCNVCQHGIPKMEFGGTVPRCASSGSGAFSATSWSVSCLALRLVARRSRKNRRPFYRMSIWILTTIHAIVSPYHILHVCIRPVL